MPSNVGYAFSKLNKNIFYSPEGFTISLSFSPSNTQYQVSNNNLNQGQTLDKVQSIYVDNSQSTTITTINVQKTGQNIIVAPNTILTIPILMSQNDLITFTNNATTNFIVTVILTDRNLPATNYTIAGGTSNIYQEIYDETQIIATNQLAALSGYKVSDIDTSTSTQYFGFIDYNGNWYIIQFNTTANTVRYAAGNESNSYSTNWTNRTSLTYTYYNTAGIVLQNQ
jgi:hypothetical protein